MAILLGFEIPTGSRVEVPAEGHLAWFGQTQLSGKTTALEAMVYRGHFKAVAFITKRGESSFLTARTVPPYFSEPTNDPQQPLWRWVQSILEASQKRTMRFEESWIIRACEEPRHAKSLADVHRNIAALLTGERRQGKRGKEKWLRRPVSGIHASVYTSLSAYFDIVLPQLEKLPYTKKLELRPGLNVMDLRGYSLELQGLVIRSVLEYVYQHERNVRVIIPEAQDFVPQGKNTPVKMACETLVRKGAADKNFMWLDSQDMAAVDKVMLRQVSVLGCGVQGQTHEINRVIDHMLGGNVRPEDIARLRIGQFYVRLPGGEVHKVYVQPAWMDSELHAAAIARGEEDVHSAQAMMEEFQETRGTHEPPEIEEDPLFVDWDGAEESMYKEKYEALKAEFDVLKDAHDKLAAKLAVLESRGAGKPIPEPSPVPEPAGLGAAPDLDAIYRYVKQRAAKDSGVLEMIMSKPELRVQVKRETIVVDGSTLRGRLAELISKGFFTSAQTGNTTFNELKRRGFPCAKPNVYRELDKLAEMGFVTKEAAGYQSVPDMRVHIEKAEAAGAK